jgi:hypothetical protein
MTAHTVQLSLSLDNATVLLVDHQVGLLSLVQDYNPDEFKNNVLALAACSVRVVTAGAVELKAALEDLKAGTDR